ncbi:MAG: M48 family metalloprotease, partial [Phycisphaeraceae bacterium]
GVRELLLWRTFGGMINAAVMGLIAPLRYILLTDALVEMVRREEVEAVMAHELAHVCRHHMFWLLAAAIGALGLLEVIFGLLLVTLVNAGATAAEAGGARLAGVGLDAGLAMLNTAEGMTAATVTMAGAAWLLVFGWVSRRIERQADTFAVQHLATARPDPERDAGGRVLVDRASAEVMIAALQQVAVLNHVPVQKRSWRHGSIAWRQAHLRRTVGQPIDALAIDRQMFWIKVASAASILLVIAFYAGVSMLGA